MSTGSSIAGIDPGQPSNLIVRPKGKCQGVYYIVLPAPHLDSVGIKSNSAVEQKRMRFL